MRLASCERRKPAARLSPFAASSTWPESSVVKNTLAWEKSGDTSTPVNVIMPTRGSRSSRWTSSESSRWIRSPSFWVRPVDLCRFTRLSKAPSHFHHLEHLELVALFDIGEVLERHAALEARLHFAHIVLEALERVDVAGVDDHVVAQHPYLGASLDHAFLNIAARDGADLRDAEYLAHLDHTEHRFLLLGREHPGERRLHLLDRVVDDVVVAHLDAGGLDELARRGVGAGVEADDHRARGHGEVHVGLGDAADARVHHAHLDLLGGETGQGVDQCLLRALHVGLDDERQDLLFALADLPEHVLELGRLLLGELHVAELALAEAGDLASLPLVGDHHHV